MKSMNKIGPRDEKSFDEGLKYKLEDAFAWARRLGPEASREILERRESVAKYTIEFCGKDRVEEIVGHVIAVAYGKIKDVGADTYSLLNLRDRYREAVKVWDVIDAESRQAESIQSWRERVKVLENLSERALETTGNVLFLRPAEIRVIVRNELTSQARVNPRSLGRAIVTEFFPTSKYFDLIANGEAQLKKNWRLKILSDLGYEKIQKEIPSKRSFLGGKRRERSGTVPAHVSR
jgi:hypothetical protein